MNKCRQCSAPVQPLDDLCGACTMERAYRIMAAEPEPTLRKCETCGEQFRLTEARVLRSVKDPLVGNHTTPFLCWVCAHLHLSASRPETIPSMFF